MPLDIVNQVTNKLLDMIVVEINKDDMKETIRLRVVHPLLEMIFKQLYPYIFTLVIVIVLMFAMLIVMLVMILTYLRR